MGNPIGELISLIDQHLQTNQNVYCLYKKEEKEKNRRARLLLNAVLLLLDLIVCFLGVQDARDVAHTTVNPKHGRAPLARSHISQLHTLKQIQRQECVAGSVMQRVTRRDE